MTEQPPATPAGWYPDGINGVRYWDGAAWTEQRAPAGAPIKGRATYVARIGLAFGLITVVLFVIYMAGRLGVAPMLFSGATALILGAIGISLGRKRNGRIAAGV